MLKTNWELFSIRYWFMVSNQDIPREIPSELAEIRIQEIIAPGNTVAITAGSRGIANIATILVELVQELRKIGASPCELFMSS